MNDIKFWHRIKLPDGTYTPGIASHGPDGGNWPTTRFAMPEDLTGKRVIDIGAWDGFFSFEAEKRGAEFVLATDTTLDKGGNWAGTAGFEYCKNALNSKVKFQHYNVEESTSINEKFDVVLCYGVLYHVKDLLRSLENLSSLTKEGGQCIIETAVSNNKLYNLNEAILEYRPGYCNDPFNFYYPNKKWIELSAKEYGFKEVIEFYKVDERATYILRR